MTVIAPLRRHAAALLAATLLLSACDGGDGSTASGPSSTAKLGQQIFEDQALSASGQLACASCHATATGFASNVAVNLGGPTLSDAGVRNAPTITYLDQTPAFFFDKDGTPTGGFNRDGRANSLLEQARRPFLAGNEMANANPAAVVAALKKASYAEDFKRQFGSDIFEQGDAAFERALFAIGVYEREDEKFHAFSSKYDAFLQGKGTLSPQEIRGLALFNNPQKGNCAACHPSSRGAKGELPLFTDFTYDNLGVPRNRNIAANSDASFFDLGLCGPSRSDLTDRADLCGAFKVPSLRNVEKTAPYFHNGQFATLEDVMRFYVRRDTHPEQFYPLNADGSVEKFNDLPTQYRANVNRSEAPYNRNPGDAPALDEAEIADVVAFLKTLSDQ